MYKEPRTAYNRCVFQSAFCSSMISSFLFMRFTMTTSNDDSVRYDQFYTPAIREHLRGFILAPGSTRLGKPNAIRSLIELKEFYQNKFQYLANLSQLF